MSINDVPADRYLNGEKPKFTCDTCGRTDFKRQFDFINHALPCKRGELSGESL